MNGIIYLKKQREDEKRRLFSRRAFNGKKL
jgi:hypothetical protein